MDNNQVAQITELLKELAIDRKVPRNVRASLEEIVDILEDEKETINVKLNTAISILDELSNDPNIQPYTRTQIWNIVSMLESIQSKK